MIRRESLNRYRRWCIRVGFAVATFATAWSPGVRAATSYSWVGGTGNWSTAANWSPNTGYPQAAGDTANFLGGGSCTMDTAVSGVAIVISNLAVTVTQGTGVNVSATSLSISAGKFAGSNATLTVTGSVTVNGGTFNGGTGNVQINGALNLSSGTFKSTTGLLQVGGAFNATSTGIFNPSTGRVMLTATGTQAFATNSATFNNLFINDGLVGYWKLDDSGTTATDASGYGNDGTLSATGATWQSAAPSAIDFTDAGSVLLNGSAGYVTLGTSSLPSNGSAQTISLWLNPANTTQNGDMIALLNGFSSAIQVKINAGNIGAYSWGGGTLISTTAPSANAWHHLAYVYDGAGHQTLYLDGTSKTATVTNQSGSASLAYLGTYGPTNEMFNGSLDEVRVYNRALSAAEIAVLAAGGATATGTGVQNMSGSPIISGDLTIASGTLAASTNSLTVGGNWWNYGNFTGTGTVTFNGSNTGNAILLGGDAPAGLTISGTGSWSIVDTSTFPVILTGSYTQSAGTFTSINGLLKVGGAFNKTGGTFNANGGQVMLSSTSNQTLATNGATFNNLIINDGLIGYWKLDDASSPAIDYSGYGNNLTWQNSATSSGTVPTLAFADPKSLSLSGATQDAALTPIPSTVQVSLPITVSAWYSATTTDTSGGEILTAGDSYALRLIPGGVSCVKYLGSNSWINMTASPAGALNGNWHHLACVLATTGMTLYLDGTAVVSNTDTNPVVYPAPAALNLSIGRHGATQTTYDFTGKIDEVRLYNRALSQAQITALASGYQPGSGSATQAMTGSPTIAGDLTIASGTLSAGSNNLTVGGNWWNYGGMFSGTGTATFNGTGISNAIRSAGQDFGALTVSGTGTWTVNDRLSVSGGALAISAGTLNASGYAVRAGSISTGGTFTTTGATVVVDGASNSTLPALTAGALRVEDPSESNLVAYWKLDNAQGTTFRDYSGSGNTGTLFTGSSWVTSSLPSIGYDDPAAVSLDGTTGYGSAPATNVPHLAAAMTVSFWAYWPSVAATAGTGQNMVVLSGGGTLLQIGLWHDQTLGIWSNGGNNMLTASSTPASGWHHIAYTSDGTTRKFYVDGGTPTTTTATPYDNAPTTVFLGSYDGANEFFNGKLDDVRIYSTPLSATQIASLAAGRYPGTGGTATVTLGGNVTLDGALALDSGSLSTSTFNLTAANSTSTLATVSAGTLTVGSGTVTVNAGATFQSTGTLTMATSGGNLAVGSGKTLTIDGTLNASSTGATIKSAGASGTFYTFTVGSTATATPTLNISGLAVKNTNGGMAIGSTTAALPVFTKFDNIAFTSSTGSQLLSIKSASLYLSSSGCSFDTSTTKDVLLAGNGTADGETRVVFGGATCNGATCGDTNKSDDDKLNAAGASTPDGVGDNPSTNGAVVEFVRAYQDDTAGSIIGFPTAAFDWNTFTYYSTYAAFHNASGSNTDVVYVRDEKGNPLYSWTVPTSGETITGTPQWTTVNSKHYVFVATSAGKVYRLVDTATTGNSSSATLTLDTGTGAAWTTNPYVCSCTITTPLAMDANNVYWGSTTSNKNFWTVGIASETVLTLALTPVVTSAGLTIASVSSTTYAFMGVTTPGGIVKISTAGNSLTATNSSTGMGVINGRVVVGYSKTGTQRVFAGDDAGNFWALDPGSAFNTNGGVWKYPGGSANAINGSPYYDHDTNTVQFGTNSGTIVVLTSGTSSATLLNTAYPYTPSGGGSGDPITAAPLYYNGILVVGSTKGKLYFLDRNTGTSVSIVKEYYFGPTESVSGIGYDPTVDRYMVTTANSSTLDGRVYFFDSVTDPTSSSL